MTTKLIGVTGGIGSGKSMVCRICALRGIPVYDCDSRAKILMCQDSKLRDSIISEAGEEAYMPDGRLDTAYMSRHIFSDHTKRHRIEAVVHAAVLTDIDLWLTRECADSPLAMVESAILHTSRLDMMVDDIWLVEAPIAIRIERVKARSALTDEQIMRRMAIQQREFDNLPADKTFVIDNNGIDPLMLQIDRLLAGNVSFTIP